ncbi:low affinity sodium-glucose cotransporter [Plakobranchus ocellatus]|uniref:Low affinity sodium-glucose cotransporter n=1 Tax=Plakobranchus ocellatus TaxID=259542 RepID=A0AAV3ZYH9_9GAST|nr:low affinity sodium-glucose cotransporter [Plakobranchus ocellatus]
MADKGYRQPVVNPASSAGLPNLVSLSSRVFGFTDVLVVVLCIAVIATVTYLASRKISPGLREFFLADRSFSFAPVAFSMFMSDIGSASFVGAAGAASKYGLSVYAYELHVSSATFKRRRTLEAAVHVSNNTCFEILSFFDASAHQVGNLLERRSYPLCFTA